MVKNRIKSRLLLKTGENTISALLLLQGALEPETENPKMTIQAKTIKFDAVKPKLI